MDWIALFFAGVLECGWPVGLKLGRSERGAHWGWIAFAIVCMASSGALLLYAQLSIPMGTAYAVWTGIGAAGTVLVGIILFKEPAAFWRLFFLFTLIASIIGLKFVSGSS